MVSTYPRQQPPDTLPVIMMPIRLSKSFNDLGDPHSLAAVTAAFNKGSSLTNFDAAVAMQDDADTLNGYNGYSTDAGNDDMDDSRGLLRAENMIDDALDDMQDFSDIGPGQNNVYDHCLDKMSFQEQYDLKEKRNKLDQAKDKLRKEGSSADNILDVEQAKTAVALTKAQAVKAHSDKDSAEYKAADKAETKLQERQTGLFMIKDKPPEDKTKAVQEAFGAHYDPDHRTAASSTVAATAPQPAAPSTTTVANNFVTQPAAFR